MLSGLQSVCYDSVNKRIFLGFIKFAFVFSVQQRSLIRGSSFWRHGGSGPALTLSTSYHLMLMISRKEVMPMSGN